MRAGVLPTSLLAGVVFSSSAAWAQERDNDHRIGVRGGADVLFFRARAPGASGPSAELMYGPTVSYERTVLPARFRLGVAAPLLFASNRIDFPGSVYGKVVHRAEAWDLYFAPGFAVIVRLFQDERENQERRADELSVGGKLGFGGAWRVTPQWNLDIDAGYTFIPVNSTVTHQLSLAVGVSYGF